jgi:hypothetical protein
MRRTTVAALLTASTLALAGCSASVPKAPTKTTVTATKTATSSLSQAETARLCIVAVSKAAPRWEDWNFDLGSWQDDPRTPAACQPLADEKFPPRGNRKFQDALIAGLELADDPRADQ